MTTPPAEPSSRVVWSAMSAAEASGIDLTNAEVYTGTGLLVAGHMWFIVDNVVYKREGDGPLQRSVLSPANVRTSADFTRV